MSLRWKLFRFLSAQTVLAAKETESNDFESTAFPSLSPRNHANNDLHDLLNRFSATAQRALHVHSFRALYAFALPRAVVQIFNLPSVASSNPSSFLSFPSHLSFSPHHSAVIAICFVDVGTPLPFLVTLGIDDSRPSVKIWSFASEQLSPTLLVSSTSAPEVQDRPAALDTTLGTCIATYRFRADCRPTALALRHISQSPYLAEIAIGFSDGVVVILSGDIRNERATRVRVAPAPGEMIEPRPILFLEYAGMLLYAVSEVSVVLIQPLASEDPSSLFRRTILDNLGVSARDLCCVLQPSRELVIAKSEALYFFNRDGRGPCLAFPTEGANALISPIANYIVHSNGKGAVTVYDVVNKLIAHRGKGIATCVFTPNDSASRSLLICMVDGSICKLSEISLEERVNMLLKRGLYVPAVNLARAECATDDITYETILTSALRQYSEFLMKNGRYDEAAEQLIETIGGAVEPSWVIVRLVEQCGLRSGLRLYLEALHAAGKAIFVHTKVLITCYRHDRARGAILEAKASEKTTDEYVINVFSDVDWTEEQVDAAIKLCREAGLYRVAERVARRRGRFVQLAKTLITDLDEIERAVQLLQSLADVDALGVIQTCGRELLVKEPALFVNYLQEAMANSANPRSGDGLQSVLRIDDFLPLFVDMPHCRAGFLQKLLARPGGVPTMQAARVWILLFESLSCVDLAERVAQPGHFANVLAVWAELEASSSSLVGGQRNDNETEQPDDWDSVCRWEGGRRALRALQNLWSVIDSQAALEIAEQYGHGPCLEYLYEHLRMYKQLGAVLRMAGDQDALLRGCRRHGDREPLLWVEAIRLFAPIAAQEYRYSSAGNAELAMDDGANEGRMRNGDMSLSGGLGERYESLNRSGKTQDVLDEAIQAVERCVALSPLEILETVTEASCDSVWGIIRDYFERHCATTRREAVNVEHGGQLLETEICELRKESRRLRDETVVIKATTCAACEDTIGLPAVHFFCGHSFHAACSVGGNSEGFNRVSDGVFERDKQTLWSEECRKCAVEWDGVVSMRQAVVEKNERHDEFFATMKSARDGFDTVLEFLERSPFSGGRA